MTTPAGELFNSLKSMKAIDDLIEAGEAEGQYLECKSPHSPQLEKGLQAELAKVVSGFSNSGGGVIIWGVSTTTQGHSGRDVLSQIEPIGKVKTFAHRIDSKITQLVYPSIQPRPSRIITRKTTDTKGVVVTLVSPTLGDPVQIVDTKGFWFRSGDQLVKMPYEMLKRLFAGTQGPDLAPLFKGSIVKGASGKAWKIPVVLENNSSFAATEGTIMLEILNPDACESISVSGFNDVSDVNPGKRIFMSSFPATIYRGLDMVQGDIAVSMKKIARPKRILKLGIELFASGMRARRWEFSLKLTNKGFTFTKLDDKFLF